MAHSAAASQAERPAPELSTDAPDPQTVSAVSSRDASVPRSTLRRYAPEVGAQCGNPARWDLRGGPPARAVPTATLVFAATAGGMVMVCWVQQAGGGSGGGRISGRPRSRVSEDGRRGQRTLPRAAGH